uniref:Uncharacterized protein n=1 Tax=Quercus lobata TaxID=97700 RepID=A0A7N2R4Q4_QUELO
MAVKQDSWLLLAFYFTRKGYCLLYQQVKMESKYLQMLKVYGFCVLLKIKLFHTSRVDPTTIAKLTCLNLEEKMLSVEDLA